MKIFIIAGELSGDLLASKVVKELKKDIKNLQLQGVGGDRLKAENLESIFSQDDLNIMGFVEVVPAIPKILKRIKQTVDAIISFEPDLVITVDAPDFNFRVIKKLKKLNYNKAKLIHLVAPTVWAYREKRAKKISKLYDLLLVLFPFEPPYFEKYGLSTKFIGHPIIFEPNKVINTDYKRKYKINPSEQILTITLGSRGKEISTLAPIFKEVITNLERMDIRPVIVIPTFDKYKNIVENIFKEITQKVIVTTTEEEKLFFFECSTIALAKSGTNTFEIAKLKTPFMVAYKVNYLTYFMLKLMVKTKYVNLINILAKKEVVPEFIQKECVSHKITKMLSKLLVDQKYRNKQLAEQNKYLNEFINNKQDPSEIAAKEILSLIKR